MRMSLPAEAMGGVLEVEMVTVDGLLIKVPSATVSWKR